MMREGSYLTRLMVRDDSGVGVCGIGNESMATFGPFNLIFYTKSDILPLYVATNGTSYLYLSTTIPLAVLYPFTSLISSNRRYLYNILGSKSTIFSVK